MHDEIVSNNDRCTIKSRLTHRSTGQNSIDSADSAFYDPVDPKNFSRRSTPNNSFYRKIEQEVRASSCSSFHQNPPCAILEKDLIITKSRLAISLNKETMYENMIQSKDKIIEDLGKELSELQSGTVTEKFVKNFCYQN